ncbi:MAG: 4-(cytidine 5'-diphospho)-2-C-methyl-D-erythritol kinase [Bacteroidetes bacterium]|nr:MAG: 4-(cytidine 5'-diphospho)-2-C-methyl-D-erythritol kinase [Bacteroidota bacterium]
MELQNEQWNEQWIAYSFAKINLGLRLLERLPNGYHTLETGFAYLEWSDRFEVTPAFRGVGDLEGGMGSEGAEGAEGAETGEFHLEILDSEVPADESNLITRAYHAFEEAVGLQRHYHFRVNKRIPAGAGLGGGSSNAALTLRILNECEGAELPMEKLAEIGSELGADVPFFLSGKTAIGRGTGTDLEEADIQPDGWIVTVWPGFASSTAEAYRYCEVQPDPGYSITDVLLNDPLPEWQNLLMNDLEAAVIPRHEMVGHLKDQLLDLGADYAAMSGSGSSVFGIFEYDFVAIQAYESFHKLGFAVNLTRPRFVPDIGIYRAG